MIQEVCSANGLCVEEWHEMKWDRVETRLLILGYWLDRGWISGAEWLQRMREELSARHEAMPEQYEGPYEPREPPQFFTLPDGRVVMWGG